MILNMFRIYFTEALTVDRFFINQETHLPKDSTRKGHANLPRSKTSHERACLLLKYLGPSSNLS